MYWVAWFTVPPVGNKIDLNLRSERFLRSLGRLFLILISSYILLEMKFYSFTYLVIHVKKGWHLPDSVARIGMTGVVPVRKLVVNWREVCLNMSWLRVMSRWEFWNVQNFGPTKLSDSWTMRELFMNSWQCGRMRDMPRLSQTATISSRTDHVEFTSSSRPGR